MAPLLRVEQREYVADMVNEAIIKAEMEYRDSSSSETPLVRSSLTCLNIRKPLQENSCLPCMKFSLFYRPPCQSLIVLLRETDPL